MKHRTAARGLLVENNKVLFIKYKFDDEVFYALPGGQHNVGETLKQCVQREFKEETEIDVKVNACILVNEFMSEPFDMHQVEIIFKVERNKQLNIKASTYKDPGMVGFFWLDRKEMEQLKYYPPKEIDWFFSDHININELYFIESSN